MDKEIKLEHARAYAEIPETLTPLTLANLCKSVYTELKALEGVPSAFLIAESAHIASCTFGQACITLKKRVNSDDASQLMNTTLKTWEAREALSNAVQETLEAFNALKVVQLGLSGAEPSFVEASRLIYSDRQDVFNVASQCL